MPVPLASTTTFTTSGLKNSLASMIGWAAVAISHSVRECQQLRDVAHDGGRQQGLVCLHVDDDGLRLQSKQARGLGQAIGTALMGLGSQDRIDAMRAAGAR